LPVRWYADESVLGFGKLLAAERADVTYPGHPAAPEILPGALDIDWMPIVARFGWWFSTVTDAFGPVRPKSRSSRRRV
jgi:hypothetical protein